MRTTTAVIVCLMMIAVTAPLAVADPEDQQDLPPPVMGHCIDINPDDLTHPVDVYECPGT